MKWIVLICAIVLGGETGATNASQAEDVIELIRDGLADQPAHPSGRAIVLVGLTGAGKTTLAKFITGDNSRLVSVAVPGQAEPTPCSDYNPDDDYYDYDGHPGGCEPEEAAKEYYIKDLDDDKIGNDITISKTFYPDLFVDATTSEVVIDCPGFADTRSESHEIAIAVFMKNIFQWAKQTKIVVVVNYGDVTRTGGRNEFKNLLRFVTVLLKNYQKFNASLGLVATKVTNAYNSQQKLISDEAMIAQIADFFGSVRGELEQQDPDDTKVQVLTTLLKQIGRLYPNIGIFRRPYEEGPLQNITAFQTGKKKIRKMMFSNLDYTNSTASDIGFAISPASEAVVIDMCEKIKVHIDSLLNQLRFEFTGYYDAVVNNSRNYDELSGWLKRESNFLAPRSLNESAPLEDHLEWFVHVLVANNAASYLRVKSTIETIRNQTTYLDFLKDLTSSPKVKPNESWKTEINSLVQYVEELSEWYEFLVSFFNRFAKNDVQSRKTTIKFDNMKHWPLLKSFVVDDVEWPANPKVLSKALLVDHEQKSLEEVLHVLLDRVQGHTTFPNANTCELQIDGYFVRISDFQTMAPLCGDRTISATYIFAQHTVFFDTDFSKVGSEMLLGIVAPQWDVVGNNKILLTGSTGSYLPQNSTGAGIAGLPGEPSGTFFGVGSDFINPVALQIFANGGRGGPGQMGRNGADGHGDVDPDKLHDRACVQKLYCGSCARRTYNFDLDGIKYKMDQTACSRVCGSCCPDYTVKFTIEDGPGPTRGFNGGKSGLGGRHSTSSQLIDLRGQHKVSLNNDDGSPGLEGQGGKGGLGGIKNGVYTTFVSLKCFVATLTGIRSCRRNPVEPGTRAHSAEDGLNNVAGLQSPPRPAKNHATYSIISKYRLFLTNLWLRSERAINNVDVEFVEGLAKHKQVQNLINLYDLMYEFIALEEIRKQNPGSSKWIPILDLMLRSVEAVTYSQTNANAAVANYLSAAILSRKLNVEYQFDRNLIIDVRLFLNEVSNQMDKLAKIDQKARLKALQTIYNHDIISKQKEADMFLNQQFSKEMDLVERKIEASIDGLLGEVSELLAQLESDRQQYIEKIKKAQVKFALNIVFGFLKVVAQLAKVAGPQGKIVGSVLDAGIGFGQKFTQPGKEPLPNTQIPAAIDTLDALNRQFEEESRKKIRLLETRFYNETSANPNEQRVLDGAKTKLRVLVGSTKQFSTIQAELSTIIENLRKDNKIVDSDLLDRVQTVILLTRPNDVAAYESLHQETQRSTKMRSSLSEIKKLKQGLKEVEANIKKVAAYERFVDDSLSNYLKNLTGLMVAIKNGAQQSSAISLEISRFNIQKVLLEVRSIINKYTAGFSATEELILCIDMLDNLMRTTINVYDQIQKYNDQINLGDFIVGINEAGLNGLTTNDTQLNTAIQKLDHTVVSSTIQNQYVRVMQAFQQLVFPFAPLFLPALQTADLGSAKDDELMQVMISKIGYLQSKINDMQSSVINGYDDQLFSSDFDEKQPFYVWNNVEHEQKIAALLRGDEVPFKANVVNSVANAVKFNDIRLKFVSSNLTDQTYLDAYLRSSNVRLTHAGNSHYKCGDSYYIIPHQLQVIEMSVASDERGEPVSSNAVYKKIRTGDILLSPYTLWKLQIVDRFSRGLNVSQLFGKIQLKLLGKGQYIKRTNPICEQSLERYYLQDQVDENVK